MASRDFLVLAVAVALATSGGARTLGPDSPALVLQTGHHLLVSHLAFNASRTLLATVGGDSQLVLWDVSSGLQFARIRLPDTGTAAATGFADSDRLVFAAGTFGIYGFDVATGTLRWKHAGNAVAAAAMTGADRLAVYKGARRQLDIIDVRTGITSNSIAIAAANPMAMAVSPDGTQVAVGDFDRVLTIDGNGSTQKAGTQKNRVTVYDVASGRAAYELRCASSWASAIAFSADGSVVAVGSYERVGSSTNRYARVTVEAFDTETRARRTTIELPVELSTVSGLAFDGNTELGIGIAGNDADRLGGALLLANLDGRLSPIESPIGSVWTLAAGGRGLWAGVNGSAVIQLWDAAVRVPTYRLAPQGSPATRVAFDPADTARVLLSTGGGQTQVFDLRLGVVVTLPVGEAIVRGDLVAGRTRANTRRTWAGIGDRPLEAHTVYRVEDFKARAILTTERSSEQSAGRISLDPSGRYFAESIERYNQDSEIRVWDLAASRLLFTVKRAAQTRTLDFLDDALVVEDATGLAVWSVPRGASLLDIADKAQWVDTYIAQAESSVQRIARPDDFDRAKHRSLLVTVRNGVALSESTVGYPEAIRKVGPAAVPYVPENVYGHRIATRDRVTGKRILLDYIVCDAARATYRLSDGTYRATADESEYKGDTGLLDLPTTRYTGVSPDSSVYVEIAYEGDVFVWSLETGAFKARLPGNGYPVTSWMYSADSSRLITATEAGDATIWDLRAGTRLGSVVSLNDGDWVALDAEQKFFFGSRGAELKMAYRVAGKAVPFEQFDLVFNRPDVVLRSLGAASAARITAAEKAYDARRSGLGPSVEPLDDVPLPELDVHNPAGVSTGQAVVELALELVRGTGSARVNATNNDSPIVGVDGKALSTAEPRIAVRVPLAAGANELTFSVTDSSGVESLRHVVRVMRLGTASPRTYVVAIGISHYDPWRPNLPNAVPDAEAVAATFKTLRGFAGPEPLLITEGHVGPDLEQRIEQFVGDATVDDRLVIYIAGHGRDSRTDGYRFLLPRPASDPESFVSYARLERLLSRVLPLRKIVFLDTCFAGGETPVQPDAADQEWRNYDWLDDLVSLRRTSGAIVVAASTDAVLDRSIASDVKRGPFAQALIEALTQPTADANRDGRLSTSELRTFVYDRVTVLSSGFMTPVTRSDNLRNDFAIR